MTEAEEIQKRVAELMSSGRYASREALLLEALVALEERDLSEELERTLNEAIAQADSGRLRPLNEVFDALEARMRRG